MAQCKKCKQFVASSSKTNDVVKCKQCDGTYHKKCIGKNFKKSELCDDCSKEVGSPKVEAPKITVEKNATIESVLAQLNQKMEILYKLQSKIDKLTEDVSFYSEQYQGLFDFKGVAENKIKALENKNVYLDKCNKALEEQIALLESKDKERNVEIYGIQWTKEEDVTSTAKTIACKLGLKPESVCEVKRVGEQKSGGWSDVADKAAAGTKPETPAPRNRQRALIVTLRSRAERDQWLAMRKVKLSNADLYGENGDTTRIFINEDLTKYMRHLLWQVKTELKPNPFKYVWVQDGKILHKRDDPNNKKIWSIRTAEDLARIKAANT